jgi:signal transduction histidine kinase
MHYLSKIKHTKIFLVICFLLLFLNSAFSQELLRHEAIAAFVYNFAKNIQWKNEAEIKEFHFLVIGQDEDVINELTKLAKTKTIRNKPIIISSSLALKDTANVQLIFVLKDKEKELKNIFRKISGKNILLVSDGYKDNRFIMVNLFESDDNKLLFEINKSNIEKQNLKVMPNIILLGGKEIDIVNLYKESQDTLLLIKENIDNLKQQLSKDKQQLELYGSQIEKSYNEIAKQKVLIEQQTLEFETQGKKIIIQRSEIQELQANIKKQLINIDSQKELLAASEKKLLEQKNKIDNGNLVLSYQLQKTDSLSNAIRLKTNILKEQSVTIANQKNFLFFLIVIFILSLGLSYAIYLGYKNNKNANKKLNEQKSHLERTQEQLIQTNATKDKFFSIIAHDLRNPFSGIIGSTGLLLKENELSDEETLAIIQMTHNSAKQGYSLLENLMEWSSSQTGRIGFSPTNFILKDIASKCIEITSNQARAKDINVINNVPDNYIIKADEYLLYTILRNLLTNAIKFTPNSGTVTMHSKEIENTTEISVTDTGIGIPAEAITKLFRIDTTYIVPGTADEKGTGLGLILCKEFVEKHGGKIWAESQPGKGSTFIFTIPNQN